MKHASRQNKREAAFETWTNVSSHHTVGDALFFKFFDGLKCAREKGEGKRTLDDDGGERAHASERLRCYNSEKELSVNVSE